MAHELLFFFILFGNIHNVKSMWKRYFKEKIQFCHISISTTFLCKDILRLYILLSTCYKYSDLFLGLVKLHSLRTKKCKKIHWRYMRKFKTIFPPKKNSASCYNESMNEELNKTNFYTILSRKTAHKWWCTKSMYYDMQSRLYQFNTKIELKLKELLTNKRVKTVKNACLLPQMK